MKGLEDVRSKEGEDRRQVKAQRGTSHDVKPTASPLARREGRGIGLASEASTQDVPLTRVEDTGEQRQSRRQVLISSLDSLNLRSC